MAFYASVVCRFVMLCCCFVISYCPRTTPVCLRGNVNSTARPALCFAGCERELNIMPSGRACGVQWNTESRYSLGVLVGNWQEERMDVS